jgi:hypothetical protein
VPGSALSVRWRPQSRRESGRESSAGIDAPCEDGYMGDLGDDRIEGDTQSAASTEGAADGAADARPPIEAQPSTGAQPITGPGPIIDEHAVGTPPRLAPQVGPARLRGVRPVFWIALVAALALPAAWALMGHRDAPGFERMPAVQLTTGCTSLEVEQAIRNPKLDDSDRVTCLAVAGKISRARAMLRALPASTQAEAIARVFAVAHPIADRGDDTSAGPIMKLVVEFWPQNYMAVFHAAMSDFALGRDDTAKQLLERFLEMYAPQDVWRARANRALVAIAAHAPLDQREAHFPE